MRLRPGCCESLCHLSCRRGLVAADRDLSQMRQKWEHALRRAMEQHPDIDFGESPPPEDWE